MVNVCDTGVELCGVRLDNPVIPASGTFGFGREFAEFYDLDILGAISVKGTTREARFGNPTPRIAECRGGVINSVGLQNPGIDAVIGEELPALRRIFHKPIIANISGFSIDEYEECCAKIDHEEQVEIIEVNISCPNVHNGGMSFGTSPGIGGGRDTCRKGRDHQAGIHEAEPQCGRHSVDSPRMRGCRCRRNMPDKYDARHAHRHDAPAAGNSQQKWAVSRAMRYFR